MKSINHKKTARIIFLEIISSNYSEAKLKRLFFFSLVEYDKDLLCYALFNNYFSKDDLALYITDQEVKMALFSNMFPISDSQKMIKI